MTHIISELDSKEEVHAALLQKSASKKPRHNKFSNDDSSSSSKTDKTSAAVAAGKMISDAEVVSMDWFTACMEEQRPLEVMEKHRIREQPKVHFFGRCKKNIIA